MRQLSSLYLVRLVLGVCTEMMPRSHLVRSEKSLLIVKNYQYGINIIL